MRLVARKFLCPICLCLFSFHSFSQGGTDELKSRRKTSAAFLGISYQDIKGTNIDIAAGRALQKAYNACGDKIIMEDVVLRTFLNEDSNAANRPGDSAINYIVGDCPRFSKTRSLDPLCLSIAFILNKILDSGKNAYEGYNDYMLWQSNNMPGSMLGNNEAPESLSKDDQARWYERYALKWLKTEPDNFSIIKNQFDTAYNKYKRSSGHSDLTPVRYLIILNDSVGLPAPEELHFYLSWRSVPDSKTRLPSFESMHHNPEKFVYEMYETLLMRRPSKEELNFLVNDIKQDIVLTPFLVYYSLMTSEEYKFY